MDRVNFHSIEKKWQSNWDKKKLYRSRKDRNIFLEDYDQLDSMAIRDPDLQLTNEDLEAKINEAVVSLAEKTKTIFMLSRVSGLTYNEIAEDLDISVKTVEYHISSALKSLRILLKPYL